MSRLYDPFAAFALPGSRAFFASDPFAKPREQSVFPPVPPDVAESTLENLAEQGIGGLGYVGKVLDKTFGGRAIRGLIGGRPEELLSVVPLSDSMGLTNERNEVTGRHLAEQFGFAGQDDPNSFDMGDAAGLALEIGLDPSTYIGPGVLAKGAKFAGKYAAPAVRPLAAVDRAIRGQLGVSPSDIARRAWREGRALFDPAVMGQRSEVMQQAAQEFGRPLEKQLRSEAMNAYATNLESFQPYTADQDVASAAMRLARQAGEGANLTPGLQQDVSDLITGGKLTGQDVATIRQQGQAMQGRMSQILNAEQDLGAPTYELSDVIPLQGHPMATPNPANYLKPPPSMSLSYIPRSKEVLPPERGEGLLSAIGRMGRELPARHSSQIGREDIFKGIPGGTNQIDEWVRRKWEKPGGIKMTPLEIAAQIRQDLVGVAGAPSAGNVVPQAKKLAEHISALPAGHGEKGVGKFRQDVLTDVLERENKSVKVRTSAEMIYEGAKRAMQPYDPTNPGDLIPLEKVFDSAGLSGRAATGGKQSILAFAQKAGVNPNDIRNLGVPTDVARDMVRLGQAWSDPKALGPVLAAWDAFSTLFKTSLTAAFPSFHLRNLGSAIFNMWRSGDGPLGDLDFKAMQDAYEFSRGRGMSEILPGMTARTPDEATREFTQELITHEVAYVPRMSNTSDIMSAAGTTTMRRPDLPRESGNSLLQDLGGTLKGALPTRGNLRETANPLRIGGVLEESDKFAPVKAGRQFGSAIENWSRSAHYLALRRKGLAPADAAMEMKKYQLDYSELTDFERSVMRRTIPWYTFSRRNLPALMDDLVQKPGKLSAAVRVTTGGRTPFEFIPDYIAEGASVPIPGAPEGEQRYVSSFGLPFEDEVVKTIGSLASGDVTRAGQQLLGMSQPQVKAPLEMIFGKQLYSGRNLQDLRPSKSIESMGLDEETARKVTQVIANSPLSRVMSTADRLIDKRKGPEEKAINLLTGGRISDVDVDKQQDITHKRMLEEILSGQPGIRKSDMVYLSKKAIAEGRVSPQEMQLYRMYLDLDRKIKEKQNIAK